jgi:hypothetical protein
MRRWAGGTSRNGITMTLPKIKPKKRHKKSVFCSRRMFLWAQRDSYQRASIT